MSKCRKKYDGIKAIVVKQLATNLGYTTDYIRQCLSGNVDNKSATEVKKEYERLYKAVNNVLIKS